MRKLFLSPLFKAIFNVVTTALVGVAASGFVASITPNANLAWGDSPNHFEFYLLLVAMLLSLASTLYQAKSEFDALDDTQCKKYARKSILTAQVEKIKEDISNEKPIGKGLSNINLLLEKI